MYSLLNTSGIHPHGPVSHASVFHNVFINGGLGTTQPGWQDIDNRNLDFNVDNFDSATLDREQNDARFGGANGYSFSSFQSNRTRPLSWNLASSSRCSSAAFSSTAINMSSSSLSTFQSSVSSNSRRDGILKKQAPTERQNPKSFDKPEPTSALSQAELGDYLIGWSRYCPSLRVVQIDHRWWWERRFAGDQWALHIHHCDNAKSSDKGKEREGTIFS